MSRIRSKDTLPEKKVFVYLTRKGIRFRKHYDKVVGKPDVALPGGKRAIFIDGDFWHGWHFSKWSSKLPKFWRLKIAANVTRDKKNFDKLRRQGWAVLRIWSHDLASNKKEVTLERITRFLTQKSGGRRG